MPRPYVSFAEIKAKIPLPDVFEHFNLTGHFHQQGDTYTGVCPLPSHHHGPQPNDQQFKINKKGDLFLWHCFGDCHRGGDVIEFVKAMTGYDNAHVRLWFAQRFEARLTLTKPSEPTQQATEADKAEQPTPPLKPLSFYLNLDPDVRYLKERGLSQQTIQQYGVGLCSKGTLAGYVAIPLYRWPKEEPDENPVGYVGRWPGEDFDERDGRPRYKLPEGLPAGRIVYGLEQAFAASTPYLIVVEGPFKVYHLVQAGFRATVSTLSANVADEQAELLARTGRHIVLLFDGNEAGQVGMRRAAAKLITHTYVRVVKLPPDTEPDQLAPGQLRGLLASCTQ